MKTLSAHPFLSFAFRPFYALAAIFGSVVVMAWVLGFQGTDEVPGLLWHAREMIWGYAGAVMVGFLLTAVANWTGRPPLHGMWLAGLAALWVGARLGLYLPHGLAVSAVASGIFYVAATTAFARPIMMTRNRRNHLPVFALLCFAVSGMCFDTILLTGRGDALINALFAGMLMVAALIGFIGMRVIPFFTARRLGVAQVTVPATAARASLLLPALAAGLLLLNVLPFGVMVLCVSCGLINAVQLFRWRTPGVAGEPLLWVLFLGFAFTAAGLIAFGAAYAYFPAYLSAAAHLITVGGIGLMTLGMMARTALGHTGRPLRLPRPLPLAFWLMVLAALLRPLAAVSVSPALYYLGIHGAGTLFATALLLFCYRYLPYLWQDRADKRDTVLHIVR